MMNDTLDDARAYFHGLNHAYNAVHQTKEDVLWATYMGTSDDRASFVRAENAYKTFVSDPEKLRATRGHVADLHALPAGEARDPLLHGLTGWQALFEAHIVDSEAGRALMREIVDAEAVLFAQKQELQPRHINERGDSEVATLGTLGVNLNTNPVEERRRSSFNAFREIERWVLDHGFLDVVKLRNRFARALGHQNYFAFKLHKNERMTPDQLTCILDDFLARTDAAHARNLAKLQARYGDQALQRLSWDSPLRPLAQDDSR
jgi:hypothetical protein